MSTDSQVSLAVSVDRLHRRAERRMFWSTVVLPTGTLLGCLALLEGFLIVGLTH